MGVFNPSACAPGHCDGTLRRVLLIISPWRPNLAAALLPALSSSFLREASWSGLVPSGRRSAAICQKKTPRNPLLHGPLGLDRDRLGIVVADHDRMVG